MGFTVMPICEGKGVCFARKEGKCTALIKAFPSGKCPFQKEKAAVTDGVYYRFKTDYLEGFNSNEQGTEFKRNVSQQYSGSGVIFHPVHDPARH